MGNKEQGEPGKPEHTHVFPKDASQHQTPVLLFVCIVSFISEYLGWMNQLLFLAHQPADLERENVFAILQNWATTG